MASGVGVGGTYRTVVGMWVGVGGAWRRVARSDVGVGGVWRLAHSAISLDPTYSITSINTAGFRLGADGSIYSITQAGTAAIGEWTTPGTVGSAYTVIASLLSGSLSSGTLGSNTLGADRTWTCLTPLVAQLELQITPFGSATVIDSTVVTLTAN